MKEKKQKSKNRKPRTYKLKHEKYTLADRNNPNVATGFSDYFEFSHFETNDKEGSNISPASISPGVGDRRTKTDRTRTKQSIIKSRTGPD